MKPISRYISAGLFIGMLLSITPMSIYAKKHHKKQTFDECADYVVVGMGGSGCVIARKLSDDFKTSVIGLEAGDNNTNDPIITEPILAIVDPKVIPLYWWPGEALAQPETNFGIFEWTNGRTFGGGLSINYMLFVRGTPDVWQNIANTVESDIWSVANVGERYKALELYTPYPGQPGNLDTRNVEGDGIPNGPWCNIALPTIPSPDSEYILQGMSEVSGLDPIPDYNTFATSTVGPYARTNIQTMLNGKRESSALAFLPTSGPDAVMTFDGKGLNGRKLTVNFNSTATKLIWDDCKKNKVIGIEYVRNGICRRIKINKEVIISCGFRSAQFLQVNGIGPSELLQEAGIPVRVDSPFVGGVQTHIAVNAFFSTPNLDTSIAETPFSFQVPGAFLPDPTAENNPSERGFHWILLPLQNAANPEDSQIQVVPFLMFPKSVGSIKVQNGDPLRLPLVELNYLQDPADLESFRVALRTFLADLNTYFSNNPRPGKEWTLIAPTLDVLNNDLLLDQYIRENVNQAHHWCRQIPMGPARLGITGGAVDPRGRVYDNVGLVKGLRVADDSILPTPTDGNMGGPAVLVGWTISELIKEEHRAK